jgi:hypothetical protein
MIIRDIWCASSITKCDKFNYGEEQIPRELISAFAVKAGKARTIKGRRSDSINYFRDCDRDLSFTDFRECPAWPEVWEFFSKWDFAAPLQGSTRGDSGDAFLIRSGKIRNVVSKRALASIKRVNLRVSSYKEQQVYVFPLDSHLVGVTPTGLCSKRIASGATNYAKQFEKLRAQHAANATFLNQDIRFDWAREPSPVRFEGLVQEILTEIPEVRRVRQSGHCNEPDGGKDLSADVYSGFLRNTFEQARDTDAARNDVVRIVVQCKTSIRNIGKGMVSDIRDTVERHEAVGFLLVAFPGITRSLLDYIEAIRARRLFWIECWTKLDLEAHLRSNPGVADRYSDLVQLIDPRAAQ